MYGFNPLTPLDLLHLPVDERVSFDGNWKAQVVKILHTKAQQHIEKMNEQYVFKANKGIKIWYLNHEIGLGAYEERDISYSNEI